MTLKDLYTAVTGDADSHQRAIHARYLKLDARRRRLIDGRLHGRTLRELAEAEGVSHGSIQSAIDGALEAIRKSIKGEPRYNHTAREGVMSDAAAASVATPKRAQRQAR